MYFTVHTDDDDDDDDDTDSLIFYNIRQADRACGFSSQGQTDLCFFNSWTGRQSKLTIVLLFRKFVRTQSHKINMYRSARKSDLMDTSNPPQAVGSSTLLHS
jgi:hypothetical protein